MNRIATHVNIRSTQVKNNISGFLIRKEQRNTRRTNSQIPYFLILATILFVQTLASGTEFVFVKTPDSITVAGDSKMLVFRDKTAMQVASDRACKFRKSRDAFWVASGLLNLMFDPRVGRELDGNGDIEERVNRAVTVLQKIHNEHMSRITMSTFYMCVNCVDTAPSL